MADGPSLSLSRGQRAWCAFGTALSTVAFWLIGTDARPGAMLQQVAFSSNFFDAQARSLLHGHLAVSGAVTQIEGIVTSHGTQMYFGIVPAVLRMPVLLVTDRYDGRLSLASSLIAVVVLCVASARLARLAQARLALVRPTVLERSPRWFAAFAAWPVLASPVLFLASKPFVYHEAIVWGVAGATWGLESAYRWWIRPTRRHLVLAGLAASVAVGSRPSVGLSPMLALACFGAALLWRRRRREALGPIAAASVAFASYAVVNVARFGQLFGAPWERQVSNGFNPVQAEAVRRTGGSLLDLRYAVTTIARYLDPLPGVMRPIRLFPFVEWAGLPRARLGMPMLVEDTGSLPTAAPLMVVCALVGIWLLARTRIASWSVLAVSAAAASVVTFLFWAISHRYLSDLVPPALVLAVPGAWWLVDRFAATVVWRRWLAVAAVAAVTTVGAAGQAGLAVWYRHFGFMTPLDSVASFVRTQYRFDARVFGGTPPRVEVAGAEVPAPEPFHVLVLPDCSAAYVGYHGWLALDRTSGGGRRAVVAASPDVLAGFSTTTQLVAEGDGWRLELRPWGVLGTARVAYVPDGGEEVLGASAALVADSVVIDVVADPLNGEVGVRQDGQVLLSLGGVAASGLAVAPGWHLLEGGGGFCRSLLARL